MKKYFFSAFTAMAVLTSCADAPKADEAATGEQKEAAAGEGTSMSVDMTASTVSFIGTKPTGQHSGDFSLLDGSVMVKDNNLTGGKFTINVSSLNITDKDTAYTSKLAGHLLSPDFFDAAKYGTASFEITNVEAYDSTKAKSLLAGATHIISGNLKLKDSTKNISFPAVVTVTDAGVTTVADFNIDRSNWGLSYGNDKSLGDKFIRPEVNIKLNIAAKK